MAGIQDFPAFEEDFFAVGTLPTALTAGMAWKITDTSAAGTPTYAPVSPSATGEVALTLAATNEIENVCHSIDSYTSWSDVALTSWYERGL